MSESGLKADFDAGFFEAWADLAGDLDAQYTPPGGAPLTVQVLIDTGVAQYGDDFAPVSHYDTVVVFLRGQVEPESGATLVVGGISYVLAQRIDPSDESISRWAVQR